MKNNLTKVGSKITLACQKHAYMLKAFARVHVSFFFLSKLFPWQLPVQYKVVSKTIIGMSHLAF